MVVCLTPFLHQKALILSALFSKKIPHLLVQVEGIDSASIELHDTAAGALPVLPSVFMSVCLDVTLKDPTWAVFMSIHFHK